MAGQIPSVPGAVVAKLLSHLEFNISVSYLGMKIIVCYRRVKDVRGLLSAFDSIRGNGSF